MDNNMTIWTYLEPFLYNREWLHLAELSKRLKKPHSGVSRYLNYFEKLNILKKDMKGRLTLYKLNAEHPLIVHYLSIVEKEKLINKCKKDLIINELISFLYTALNENNKSLIFGSASSEQKYNDIDLLIIGKTNIEDKIEKFSKKINKKIHLIKLNSLKDVNRGLKEEIIKKHLIIKDTETLLKWLI